MKSKCHKDLTYRTDDSDVTHIVAKYENLHEGKYDTIFHSK